MMRRLLLLLFTFTLCSASMVLAQDPPPPGIDWTDTVVKVIAALSPIVIMLLVQVAKWGVAKLPKWAPPYLAMALGVAGSMIAQQAANTTSVIVGALLGLAATGIYEIQKYVRG